MARVYVKLIEDSSVVYLRPRKLSVYKTTFIPPMRNPMIRARTPFRQSAAPLRLIIQSSLRVVHGICVEIAGDIYDRPLEYTHLSHSLSFARRNAYIRCGDALINALTRDSTEKRETANLL